MPKTSEVSPLVIVIVGTTPTLPNQRMSGMAAIVTPLTSVASLLLTRAEIVTSLSVIVNLCVPSAVVKSESVPPSQAYDTNVTSV